MLQWILVGLLVLLIVGGGGRRIAQLFTSVKKLPDEFKRGQRQVDDPAGEAKPINAPPDKR